MVYSIFRFLPAVLPVFLFFSINCIIFAGQNQIDDPKYPFHPSQPLEFTSSNLPIVIIDLDERMKDKEENTRITADMKIIWHKDGSRNFLSEIYDINNLNNDSIIDYYGKIEIKYRGNTSYSTSAKKPFGLKTITSGGKKNVVPILGMGADNDWALLAPYNDKSMIRDVLLLDLMKDEMEYVPTGRYCELVLNGIYQGVYIMTERARTGENRINLPEPEDSGDELTGGYHLEIDRKDNPGFYSHHQNRNAKNQKIGYYSYYQYKSPNGNDFAEAAMEYQKNYITNYIRNFENVMASEEFNDPDTGYSYYLDINSVSNYVIAQEFSRNVDAYAFSTHLYKKRDSEDHRLKFSIWDFNLAFGNADYKDAWATQGWVYNSTDNDKYILNIPFWFNRLLNNEVFNDSLKTHWKHLRETSFTEENIHNKIDSLQTLLTEASVRNFEIWPILGKKIWPNYYWGNTWKEELDFLRIFIDKRIKWMDSQWNNNQNKNSGLSRYKNLVLNGNFEEDFNKGLPEKVSLWYKQNENTYITSEAYLGENAIESAGESAFWQTIKNLEKGIYSLQFMINIKEPVNGKVYIRNIDDEITDLYNFQESGISGNAYSAITIDDIEITDKIIDLVFETADGKIQVDNIQFYKEDSEGTENPSIDSDKVYTTRIVNGKIIFDINLQKNYSMNLSIYTIDGKLAFNEKAMVKTSNKTVEWQPPKKSMYIYKLIIDNKVYVNKFLL